MNTRNRTYATTPMTFVDHSEGPFCRVWFGNDRHVGLTTLAVRPIDWRGVPVEPTGTKTFSLTSARTIDTAYL